MLFTLIFLTSIGGFDPPLWGVPEVTPPLFAGYHVNAAARDGEGRHGRLRHCRVWRPLV